ncbi:MAG TPA: efflux RND transporter permease subunit, partial [Anaerolineales bacterium]|nr:efflux RND transporter permease subunit [Anaerolineales bacterium]
EKLPGTNTLEVTRGVEDALAALQPGFAAINFDATLFRPATFIEMAIANLTRTLVISALLAVLILGAFFYGWRTALISLVAILLSLVGALFMLYLRGATLNAMVLAGLVIALGLIVDDAVVDIEHIMQRLRQNRRDGGFKSAESVILRASAEMRGVLLLATLVTLLAILPVFFMSGMYGAVFQPLAISYVLAVLAAMAVALLVTPALSLILLSKTRLEGHESPLIPRLQRGYERALSKTVQKPQPVYVAAALLVVASLAVLPFLRREQMLPSFRESYLMVQLNGAPATSRSEMDRIVARVSTELRALPGVSTAGAHVGRAVFGDQVVGINSAELWVSIDPEANYDATVAAVQEVVNGYAGLDREVRTYTQDTLSQPQQTTTSDPFTVRVYGEDYSVLRSEVEKVRQALAGINGLVDSHAVLPVEEPTLEIEVDLAAAQQYGLRPGDVRRAAATLLSGLQVGSLFEQQKIFDVVVWSAPEKRQNVTDIRNLLIDTPAGEKVRLGDVADVRIEAAPTVIQREGISPYMDIGFNIRGRDVDAVLSDVKIAMHDYAFPLEYHAEVHDDYTAQQAARQNIFISVLLAAVGIFLLLQASSANWRLALAIFVTLPIAMAGGVLAAFLINGSVSVVSLFGLLAVLGISVRNCVLLIRHYHSLEKRGEAFGLGLIMRGSRERLAPMTMTALTTGLTLLPFALFGNIPGHEMVYPMAIIIIGGLVTSTLLNLFLLPALYLRFGASREPDLALKRARGSDLQPAAADD